jgi:hypothetical protein
MSTLPFYQASFQRQGFDDTDITDVSDRLVDGLIAWGDADTVAARIRQHHQAGADHVAIILMSPTPASPATPGPPSPPHSCPNGQRRRDRLFALICWPRRRCHRFDSLVEDMAERQLTDPLGGQGAPRQVQASACPSITSSPRHQT